MAVVNYHDTYGHYPPAFVADADGRPMHSWRVLLLPFLEQQSLYDQYDFSQPWDSPSNLRLAEQMPRTYAFHGEYRAGVTTTNYLAVVGEKTVWPGNSSRTMNDVTDEFSSTIMVVENLGQNVHWMEPRDLNYQTMSFRVDSPEGVSSKYLAPAAVTLDGSVRRLDEGLPEDVLRALLTINGGEELVEEGSTWRRLSDGRLRELRQPEDQDSE